LKPATLMSAQGAVNGRAIELELRVRPTLPLSSFAAAAPVGNFDFVQVTRLLLAQQLKFGPGISWAQSFAGRRRLSPRAGDDAGEGQPSCAQNSVARKIS